MSVFPMFTYLSCSFDVCSSELVASLLARMLPCAHMFCIVTTYVSSLLKPSPKVCSW